jgi:hypothetical protein
VSIQSVRYAQDELRSESEMRAQRELGVGRLNAQLQTKVIYWIGLEYSREGIFQEDELNRMRVTLDQLKDQHKEQQKLQANSSNEQKLCLFR